MGNVLKYRILEILAKLPPSERRQKRKELKEKLGHSTVMFSYYLNATIDKTLDFKGSELPVIANILECSIEELFTNINQSDGKIKEINRPAFVG